MNTDLAGLVARIEELESQAAFQEALQQRLDETVARQDREILTLQRQLRELARRLAELRDTSPVVGPSAEDEVPPHY